MALPGRAKAHSILLWATIATAVCCCMLATFQLMDGGDEQSVLRQTGGRIRHGRKSSGIHKSMLSSAQTRLRRSSLALNPGRLHALTVPAVAPMKIFNNIKAAMMKDLGLKSPERSHAVLQQKADFNASDTSDAELDSTYIDPSQSGGEETNYDPLRRTIYVYAGHEVLPHNTEVTAYILQSGFDVKKVGYINSVSDADIRSATWDEDCSAIIFPALKDVPDFSANALKDLRNFVSQGMHYSGTLLFLGSPVEVHAINEMLGYDIQQDYKQGPYYKNGRYASTSVWNSLPYRAAEMGQTQALGFLESTLPPESNSFYDSFGDSVASCTRYDLGRVCYLAQDFTVLSSLPDLLQSAASQDATTAAQAQQKIDAIEHTTDTWLAMFLAMLVQSESDIAPA